MHAGNYCNLECRALGFQKLSELNGAEIHLGGAMDRPYRTLWRRIAAWHKIMI